MRKNGIKPKTVKKCAVKLGEKQEKWISHFIKEHIVSLKSLIIELKVQ